MVYFRKSSKVDENRYNLAAFIALRLYCDISVHEPYLSGFFEFKRMMDTPKRAIAAPASSSCQLFLPRKTRLLATS